jgi:hypothetical protein
MRSKRDPLMVRILERRAKYNARPNVTGRATRGNVSVHYYPNIGRFAWFVAGVGVVNKRYAVTLVETK